MADVTEQDEKRIRDHERLAVLRLAHLDHDERADRCLRCTSMLESRRSNDARPISERGWDRYPR